MGKATVAPISQSLENIGKYTNQGFVVVYHPHYKGVTVHHKDDIVIDWSRPPVRTGWRNRSDKLWHWSLKAPSTERRREAVVPLLPNAEQATIDSLLPDGTVAMANNVYELPSIREGIRFMHAVCGFPAKSTWLKAIRNSHYVGWPLLTVTNVHKHYPETVETPRGRLNQTKAGIRSTKSAPEPLVEADEADVKQ